jgi:hypothetical protein
MPDLIIKCERCGCELTHTCNGDLRQAVIDLMAFTPHYGMPDFLIKAAKKAGFYDEGDEDVPLVSEAFLYPLLGKDDARTFMALINQVLRCAGVDPHSADLDRAVSDIFDGRAERKRLAEERQKAYQKRVRDEQKAAKKAKKGK